MLECPRKSRLILRGMVLAALVSPPVARTVLQVIPNRVCLSCEVCCRFPERDSLLRPYFTGEEIGTAVARGVDRARFPDASGSQVEVVPHPTGDGFLCPAFDPDTSECRIYAVRPLDCRLYPFVVMWSRERDEVLLGWDTKCPYMVEAKSSQIQPGIESVRAFLEDQATISLLMKHPALVGRFQEDVVVLGPLRRLTRAFRGRGLTSDVRSEAAIPVEPAGPPTVRQLTLDQRGCVEQALAPLLRMTEYPLAALSFVYHYLWQGVLNYSWVELEGHLCLFAESPDGLFLALPPLGTGPLDRSLAAAFSVMHRHNGRSSASRVENVPTTGVAEVAALGYRVVAKDPDYVYRARDLVNLAGDRYKSQRNACNRFERAHRGQLEEYDPADRETCLNLFEKWVMQKTRSDSSSFERALLEDARTAHVEAMAHPHELGLTGVIARVEGAIRGYSFGYRLTPTNFVVILEVADRTVTGLAQFLFREFCRSALNEGATFINTMEDSGLPDLAASKMHYHPIEKVPNYLVMEP